MLKNRCEKDTFETHEKNGKSSMCHRLSLLSNGFQRDILKPSGPMCSHQLNKSDHFRVLRSEYHYNNEYNSITTKKGTKRGMHKLSMLFTLLPVDASSKSSCAPPQRICILRFVCYSKPSFVGVDHGLSSGQKSLCGGHPRPTVSDGERPI